MESPSLSGRRLGGRYLVGQCIGSGGMGAVYEAVQEDLRRRVAIKVLRTDLATNPVLVERFRREALAAAGLGHAHIVQVTDFQAATGDDPPFLVMELLNGRSLHRAVRNEWPKKMSAERLARIAIQILGALDAAHAAGIVHRDIKPDNVFLCDTNVGADLVKVLDFGIAKLRDEASPGDEPQPLTNDGVVLGTPAFMAPEQALGENDVDARADVYGVGGCLFLASTGRPPVIASKARDFAAIARARVMPLGELRTDLDPRFCAIVDRALQNSRAMRFASASMMRRALEWWLTGDGPDAVATKPERASGKKGASAEGSASSEGAASSEGRPELAFASTETSPFRLTTSDDLPSTLGADSAVAMKTLGAAPERSAAARGDTRAAGSGAGPTGFAPDPLPGSEAGEGKHPMDASAPLDEGPHTTLASALATLASPGAREESAPKPASRGPSRAIAIGVAAVAGVAAVVLAPRLFARPGGPETPTPAAAPSRESSSAPDADPSPIAIASTNGIPMGSGSATALVAPNASADAASATPIASATPHASGTSTARTSPLSSDRARASDARPSASSHFDEQGAGEFLAKLAEAAKVDCSRLEGPRTQTFVVRFGKDGDIASITPTTRAELSPSQTCIERHLQGTRVLSRDGTAAEGVTAVSVTLQPLPGPAFN